MEATEQLQLIRDRVRSAVTSQREKMHQLGENNPYHERDEGYLSALQWAEGLVTRSR